MIAQPDDRLQPTSLADGTAEILAAMLAGSHVAVGCLERTTTGDMRLSAANDRFCELAGHPTGEDSPAGEGSLPPELTALCSHVIATGKPFRLDRYARRLRSGETAVWDVHLSPIGGNGAPRVVISATEVTGQVDAEAALRANEERLHELGARVLGGLDRLAGLARAVSRGQGLDDVVSELAESICVAFGLNVMVNLLDEYEEMYVVRAATGEDGRRLLGIWHPRELVEQLLDPALEIATDVFFIAHDIEHPAWVKLSQRSTVSAYGWQGPGFWHPGDGCLVRLRTTDGRDLGVLSMDGSINQPIPNPAEFEVLRRFVVIGANAIENLLLARQIGSQESEREVRALRQELMEELLLHRYLLEIGNRLGVASAAAAPGEIFPLIAERLDEVLPIKSLTIVRADHTTRTMRPIYHSEPGPIADAMLRFEAPIGAGATGKAALDGRWVIANAGPDQPAIDVPDTPDEDEHLLAVPVLVDEVVRAVLTLRRSWRDDPFGPPDARQAELFAQHVASVLLLDELAETGEELAASRRVLAEQVTQLEWLNHLKDEFVANVSHELRAPLTAIIGNIATVTRNARVPAKEREELLRAAERQAGRLGELLENLLAASRLAGEEPAVAPAPVALGPFLHEIAETLRSRAPDRPVDVEVEVEVDLLLTTDPTMLYRILFNLGDNAIKYSDEPVTIVARPDGDGDGDFIVIEVRDRGVGIAPDDLAKVFDRFAQLGHSSERRVGGVGLGLYLSSRLAAALGGSIGVESDVGTGSTFSLRLPRSI